MLTSMRHRVARQITAAIIISITLLTAACGGQTHSLKVNPPASSSDLSDQNYRNVVEQFKNAGFSNVSTEPIRDLVTGWLTSDGEVEEVSIAGDTDFETTDDFTPDSAVIIRYHTFPEEHTAPADSVTPDPTTPPADTTAAPAPAESTAPAAAETLTAENNGDLAALLALKNPDDPSVAAFAEAHQGQLIAFEGYVVNVAPHGSYDTRFDYLISSGNYDPNSSSGPNFRFTDINYYDFNFPADASPDSVPVGMNLHFVARVGAYNSMTSLFELEPVSTTVR